MDTTPPMNNNDELKLRQPLHCLNDVIALSSILVFKAVAIVVPMIMYNLFCEFFNNSKEKKNPVPRNTDNDGPLVVFFNVALYKAVGKIFPRGRRRITIKCRTTAIRHAFHGKLFTLGDYQLAFRITSRRERQFLAVVCPIAADQMVKVNIYVLLFLSINACVAPALLIDHRAEYSQAARIKPNCPRPRSVKLMLLEKRYVVIVWFWLQIRPLTATDTDMK
ncbi:hypothetical protein T4A_3224 [Trichinella pseudospiralis]|uniref:Uncharacterized protein n=1 Tax=Trichinella pseudospiralis TaxID=6337 RepID=A0A0V1EFX6_TRIPS|nr:hypothetical protein T4A_3224 [Trichinella pseudospiralis]